MTTVRTAAGWETSGSAGSGLRLSAVAAGRMRWCTGCGAETWFEAPAPEAEPVDGWAEVACVECGDALLVAVEAPVAEPARADRSAA